METFKHHPPSQDTYDSIAQWIAPKMFFSTKEEWQRMGFVGMFADYVLSYLPGAVLEIGAGESSIYLSHVAKKYDRRIIHCDIEYGKIVNPLSIKGYLAEDSIFIDDQIPVTHYDNTERSIAIRCASDDLFKKFDIPPLAFSFIDGDHRYPQVKKDFENIVRCTVDDGYICLHDTYPPTEEYLHENACGTVYKLRQEIDKDPRFDCITLVRGTAMSVGLTIVRKKPATMPFYHE